MVKFIIIIGRKKVSNYVTQCNYLISQTKLLTALFKNNIEKYFRNYKFWVKYFYQYFQIFSIFIYNEILSIFQKLQTLWQGKKKTPIQQPMTKEKLRKNGLCFITGCFIKPFKIIISFYILQAHSQHNFRFLLSGWCKKYQKGKLGTVNS